MVPLAHLDLLDHLETQNTENISLQDFGHELEALEMLVVEGRTMRGRTGRS